MVFVVIVISAIVSGVCDHVDNKHTEYDEDEHDANNSQDTAFVHSFSFLFLFFSLFSFRGFGFRVF